MRPTSLQHQCLAAANSTVTWETNLDEIKAYLGFMVVMGVNRLPEIRDSWSVDSKLNNAFISSRITRKRFEEISRYLHFVDNTALPLRDEPGFHQLQKVMPIITAMREKFEGNYNLHPQNSIDEAMIPFKGTLLHIYTCTLYIVGFCLACTLLPEVYCHLSPGIHISLGCTITLIPRLHLRNIRSWSLGMRLMVLVMMVTYRQHTSGLIWGYLAKYYTLYIHVIGVVHIIIHAHVHVQLTQTGKYLYTYNHVFTTYTYIYTCIYTCRYNLYIPVHIQSCIYCIHTLTLYCACGVNR